MKSGYFISSNGQKNERVHDSNSFIKRIDLIMAKIIYVVIHSFFKYLICNLAGGTVFDEADYQQFFMVSLKYFTDRFLISKNEFPGICKILLSKKRKIQADELEFKIYNNAQ